MSEDPNMRWVPYLPAGWEALYRQLLADLVAAGISVEVTEAKEKFGTLRVYLAGRNDDAAPFIAAAEQRSARICQQCGLPSELMVRSHFYATLCPLHGQGFVKAARSPIISLNLRYPKPNDG